MNIDHLTSVGLAYVRRKTGGGISDLLRQRQDCKVVLEADAVKPWIIEDTADICSCHTVIIRPLPAEDNLDEGRGLVQRSIDNSNK